MDNRRLKNLAAHIEKTGYVELTYSYAADLWPEDLVSDPFKILALDLQGNQLPIGSTTKDKINTWAKEKGYTVHDIDILRSYKITKI